METIILEEFIEELKQIVPNNKASFNPNLMSSQVFVIDEIIKMAEQKVRTNKTIKFLENALRNNHCLIISSVIEKFNLKDRADFNKHFEEAEKRIKKTDN
jgi:hypothetical protein